ncbi:hypothetical protein BC739_004546 [Kutzneria viridogrisea]|uniref:Uncharacterized protein n=1 Tax=Kutzneria viridogrisea TaxID=47990 RepID=A0ABR6BKB9_9PSEU|nr:hypothetical protein [Kutzneria viridogrisea]
MLLFAVTARADPRKVPFGTLNVSKGTFVTAWRHAPRATKATFAAVPHRKRAARSLRARVTKVPFETPNVIKATFLAPPKHAAKGPFAAFSAVKATFAAVVARSPRVVTSNWKFGVTGVVK